ncbi:MAG: sodium-dependent bicarbonate transport family permease [Rhodospirillales bacterium]|jgi:hypothetical protein|nr:sodium-dependent bicarbonate transport family permease [Rhodospirillales bacterium]
MADISQLALNNLLAPMTLFFALGFAAGLARSDLTIPEQIGKALSLYLMLAIGFKGGASMGAGGETAVLVGSLVAGLILSAAIPVIGFFLLRRTSRLDGMTAAAVAAHYGSVSVVTFVTAVGFLDIVGIAYQQFMVAVVAVMETPAIVVGLALAHRFADSAPRDSGARTANLGRGHLLREIFLNGSVVVLVGAFVIGWITGKPGLARIEPFIGAPFAGVLCLFLLDMGLIASRQFAATRGQLTLPVIGFALYMPLIGAALGLAAALVVGLDLGSATMLAVLAASASYIAVPAAMRIALPRANAAVYLTLSLAITFPFNILVGIPLYFAAAQALGFP